MKKNGLCVVCINDKECTFSRKYPVFQCEEFCGHPPKPKRRTTSPKMKFDEEPRVWE